MSGFSVSCPAVDYLIFTPHLKYIYIQYEIIFNFLESLNHCQRSPIFRICNYYVVLKGSYFFNCQSYNIFLIKKHVKIREFLKENGFKQYNLRTNQEDSRTKTIYILIHL